MAKKSRRHKTGSVITTRKLSGTGIGNLKNPSSALGALLPPLLGGAVAAGAAYTLEHMASGSNGQAPSSTMVMLADNAPWVGVVVGGLAAAGMYALVGAPQGLATLAGAAGVAGALAVSKMLNKSAPVAGFRGMGALVPQLQPPGMGAIVMTPESINGVRGLGDPRGEVVSLQGVNASAFGTPGFNI